MPDFIFTEKENHRSIEASVGDVIPIRLEENATTGFAWHWEDFPKDVLTLETDDLLRFENAGIGGGGVRQFRLRVRSRGNARILLNLQRRSEEHTSELQSQF